MSSQNDALAGWLKLLDPRSLKANLIAASIYLAAWETFEHAVMDRIEGFFSIGFDEDGLTFSDEYKQVLSRDKSRFRASILWLEDVGAVDAADLRLADRARQHRNEIAHNLPSFLADASRDVDVALFGGLCALLNKIERWWLRNVEIPINPDCDHLNADEIPDSELQSGNMLFLTMILKIATGDEAESSYLYDELVKWSAACSSSSAAESGPSE